MLNPAYQDGYEDAISGNHYNNTYIRDSDRDAYSAGYEDGAEDLEGSNYE